MTNSGGSNGRSPNTHCEQGRNEETLILRIPAGGLSVKTHLAIPLTIISWSGQSIACAIRSSCSGDKEFDTSIGVRCHRSSQWAFREALLCHNTKLSAPCHAEHQRFLKSLQIVRPHFSLNPHYGIGGFPSSLCGSSCMPKAEGEEGPHAPFITGSCCGAFYGLFCRLISHGKSDTLTPLINRILSTVKMNDSNELSKKDSNSLVTVLWWALLIKSVLGVCTEIEFWT